MVTDGDGLGAEIGLTGARFGGPSRRRRARAAPDPAAPAEAPPPVEVGEAPVGLTGARFGGAARRRREAARPAAEVATGPAAAGPPALPAPVPRQPSTGLPETAPIRPVLPDPGPPEASRHSIVRPYVLTGGRTRGHVDFAVEALVTSVPGADRVGGPVEHARIRDLCRVPRSVAEVAALLGMPLGVVRVLLADLLAAGAVTVHRTVEAGGPDLPLLERVLAGLHRL